MDPRLGEPIGSVSESHQWKSRQNHAAGTREPVIIPPCYITMLRSLTPPFVLETSARLERAPGMPLQLLVSKNCERTAAVAPLPTWLNIPKPGGSAPGTRMRTTELGPYQNKQPYLSLACWDKRQAKREVQTPTPIQMP